MSIKVMSWYWEHSEQEGHKLLALLALSDWANEEGECYPSVIRLAQRVRRKRRAAQVVIRELENAGEILVYPGMGKGPEGMRTPLYYLLKYRAANGLVVPPMLVEAALHYRNKEREQGQKGIRVRQMQAKLSSAADYAPPGAADYAPPGAADYAPPGAADCTPPGAADCTQIRHIDPSYRSVSIEPSSRVNPPPPILVTLNGGGGLSDHANNFQSNGLNGNHNGHHATTTDSGALRSPQSLSARSLATEWAADFAAGWASLEADLAGWTDSQIRCLLTWLYVWAIEADSQDRNLEPAARYDAGQRLATNYANVYAGSTNRIGLIKSKVAALIAVPLTEADTAALEGLIEQP